MNVEFPTIGQVTIRTGNILKGIFLDFDKFDSYYELCDYGYGVKTDSSYNLIITWNNKYFDKDYGEDDD